MVHKIDSHKVERINPLKETKVTPHEKKEKPNLMRNKRNIIIAISVVVGIALVLFLVQPAIMGLGVYDEDTVLESGLNESTELSVEEKIDLLSQQLEERDEQVAADLLQSLNEKTSVFDGLAEELDQLAACLSAKSSLEAENEMYDIRIDSLEEDLNENDANLQQTIDEKEDRIAELEAEVEDLKGSSDGLIANMAKTVCCIKKVIDPSINSYTIDGSNLVCSDSGENEISC